MAFIPSMIFPVVCLLTFINEIVAVPERFFAPRYITYSKEEEAIRCIQNVHGFVLEGRPLRYLYRDLLKLFMYGMTSL